MAARKKPAGPKPAVELIVRRGALRRFDKLKKATAALPVKLTWDRRTSERRGASAAAATERRRSERRQDPPFTWQSADFVVVARRPRRGRRSG